VEDCGNGPGAAGEPPATGQIDQLEEETMKTLSIAIWIVLLTACASGATERNAKTNAAATAKVDEAGARVPAFRIRDWAAVNDHMLVVTADDGTRYRAETIGPCLGLNFANRMAFVNRGGFEQVDRFSTVVLGDGTRCALQSFDKLVSAEAQALDSYEKSKEGAEEAKP
jgi:hypothetical protein